jgi:hypothetical protein
MVAASFQIASRVQERSLSQLYFLRNSAGQANEEACRKWMSPSAQGLEQRFLRRAVQNFSEVGSEGK